MANAANRSIACLSTVLLFGVSAANAGTIVLGNAMLSGAQEVPAPTGSLAVGAAILQVDDETGAYDFELFVSGITSADLFNAGPNSTPVHLHSAPAGSNGGIVVDVASAGTITDIGTPANGFKLSVTGGTFGGTQGALDGPPVATNIADLLANNLYVNVHTNAFNGGEIRGQLVPKAVPEPATMSLGLFGLAALCALRKSAKE